MRRLRIIGITSLLLALSSAGPAATWEFDPVHTGVQFKVRHLMVSHVRGDFEKVSGKIVYDERGISRSSADITIDASSINTRVAKRDEHLKSPDFLDAAKYPSLVFKSKKVEKAGDGKLKMTGDLTIRGVTKGIARGRRGSGESRPRKSTGRISGSPGTRRSRPGEWSWATRWKSPSTPRFSRSGKPRESTVSAPGWPAGGSKQKDGEREAGFLSWSSTFSSKKRNFMVKGNHANRSFRLFRISHTYRGR